MGVLLEECCCVVNELEGEMVGWLVEGWLKVGWRLVV
jgi:hypothetical protein